jgi:hypothetical protein
MESSVRSTVPLLFQEQAERYFQAVREVGRRCEG